MQECGAFLHRSQLKFLANSYSTVLSYQFCFETPEIIGVKPFRLFLIKFHWNFTNFLKSVFSIYDAQKVVKLPEIGRGAMVYVARFLPPSPERGPTGPATTHHSFLSYFSAVCNQIRIL